MAHRNRWFNWVYLLIAWWIFPWLVTICLFNIAMENHGKSPFLIGNPSINGPFSMAMLNNQRLIS
jgi:hypothetical protein